MKRSTRLSLVFITILGAACSDDGSGTVGDGGASDGGASDGGGAVTCVGASDDRGTLSITFTGLPTGVVGQAYVNSPIDGQGYAVRGNDSRMLLNTVVSIAAMNVAAPAPLVRTAYRPVQAVTQATICGGQTQSVTIAYEAIPSSGKLWAGNRNKPKNLIGFGAGTLAASGAPAATVSTITAGHEGVTFDRDGHLWVIGGTTADPALARYGANKLGASSAQKLTPDVTISLPSFGAASGGPTAMAFDGSGNLWVSLATPKKIVKLEPAQLTTSGQVTPKVELGGIDNPVGLAFDGNGQLFAASANRIVRLNSTRLSTSGDGFDLAIEVQRAAPASGARQSLNGLAFDKDGALWAAFGSAIVKIPAADLAGTGQKTLTPAVQIEIMGAKGLAFDEAGGLWFGPVAEKFSRLAPDQLTSGGMKTPSTEITSADIGYTEWFSLYPAPAGLPLFHSLPAAMP